MEDLDEVLDHLSHGHKVAFFLTFGLRYRREGHPTFEAAHPDGYVTVWAYTYEEARRIVAERIGSRFCGLYEAEHFDPSFYPLGSIEEWGK